MAIYSLNSVLKGLSDISVAHKQINSFGFGDVHEFASSGVTQYPAMWVELRDANRGRATTTYNLRIYLFDLTRNGETNETEVLSDLHRVAEDIYAELHHGDWTWNFPLTSILISSDTEATDDIDVAVWFDAPIQIIQETDRCQIPETSITRF